VRAHIRVVVLITLLTFAAATAAAARRPVTYTASADILVTPLSQNDINFLGIPMIRDDGDPTRTVQTAAALIDTPQTALITSERIPGATREGISGAVGVQTVGQSDVLAVSATASTPQRAALIANTYAASALAVRHGAVKPGIDAAIAGLRNGLMAPDPGRLAVLESVESGGDPTLSLSTPAFAPAGRDGTATWVIALVGLFAGFLLASIVALLLGQPGRDTGGEEQGATA
jgi:uncharacterized protein involved in exopolysaccharide biosynthesis